MREPKRRARKNIKAAPDFEFWAKTKSEKLPRKFICPQADIFTLLESRRSTREFTRLGKQYLSSLLWFSQRQIARIPNTENRIFTPSPTFGALAAVRTLVLPFEGMPWVYNRASHSADYVDIDPNAEDAIRQKASEYFNIGEGCLLLFFAVREFVDCYYENSESLVLREAGLLMGNLTLLSEAFDLACCMIGAEAGDWIAALLDCSEQAVIPAGCIVIGGRKAAPISAPNAF